MAEPWFIKAFGGKMSPEYIRYMSEEWGFEKRGDQALFEKLSLEGAQAGLSWSTILHKRDAYRRAFRNFDIETCAGLSVDEIPTEGIVRHKAKIASVIHNAKCVQELQKEVSFDAFLWSYVDDTPQLNEWKKFEDMPCQTDVSRQMAADLKKRGFKFVGPTICYSLMQSCGLVIDHPVDTPEWQAARDRLAQRQASKRQRTN